MQQISSENMKKFTQPKIHSSEGILVQTPKTKSSSIREPNSGTLARSGRGLLFSYILLINIISSFTDKFK